MHRLISMYNKNRLKVWAIILMIILGLSLIRVLNQSAKNKSEANKVNESNVTTTENNNSLEETYEKESETIISSGKVSEKYQEKFGKIIDEFYTACINGDTQTAYNLLSDQCKRLMYPNQNLFESLYCREKFSGDKEYSFQSWDSSEKIYMYQVKIFDNMLATGKSSDQGYIEDYITLVPYEDSFKLNINNYIETISMGDKSEDSSLTIQVDSKDVYKDYEIYKFKIKNNTQDTMLLDTGKKTNTMYLVDELENKYYAFSYEKSRTELTIEPGEVKSIEIKYDRAFNGDRELKTIVFSNVVKYDEYLGNQSLEGTTVQINVVE